MEKADVKRNRVIFFCLSFRCKAYVWAEKPARKNCGKLRHRRKRGSASSIHGIRKKHKPNNRKSAPV